MIKLVIFDLDGTLLNTIDDLATSTNHALRRHGFPTHALTEYPYFVGNGINKLLERALPETERTKERIQQVRKDFIAYYEIHNTDLTIPYPGISELLQELHKQGIGLAVASNKYHQGTVELIKYYFGTIPFKAVFGQQDGIPVKPDPQIVRQILSLAEVHPDDVLYVGDSGVDMQTAANSGITSIGVTWGFRPCRELEENGACFIAESPQKILSIINKCK